MIAELTKSYPGVKCRQCGAAIPVSAKVAFSKDEIGDCEADKELLHSFLARCKACEFETRYAVDEVQKFDGEPRKRTRRGRAA